MAVIDKKDNQFPKGMHVLAVDDDRTCLVILKAALQKCHYQVTTTNSAITALQLLREKKNKFDLVISDVHMPDMDGFKLLELVGLEMDLPVIMLSVNDDPRVMMKGIMHGACFYLIKPVKIEELKNIWQHVIRRNKLDSKGTEKAINNHENPDSGGGSGNELTTGGGASDQSSKPSRKRKEQDEDEDEDEDHENSHDNGEDPSAQKKPRVVWSLELHRKFVAAVEQLGIDKAVPKKILDLMNVEKLTRENVASHLQKYRLYLRRVNTITNQQHSNIGSSFSSGDTSSYLRMSPLTGIGQLQTLNNSGYGLRSFSPSNIIGRLNTPSGLNAHGFNSNDNQFQFPSSGLLGRPGGNTSQIFLSGGGLNSVQNLSTIFDPKQSFSRQKPMSGGGSSSPILGVSNNGLFLEQNHHHHQGGIYDNNPNPVGSSSPEQISFPSLLHHHHGNTSCNNDMWSNECNNLMNSPTFQGGNLSGGSSITSLSSQSHDSFTDMNFQGVNFSSNNNNVQFQGWNNTNNSHNNQNGNYHSLSGLMDPLFSNSSLNRNMEFDFCDAAAQMKHGGVIDLTEDSSLKSQHQLYKTHNTHISNNAGSLEDFVTEIMKQKQDKIKLPEGDFLCDTYSPGGTSM